MDFHNYLSGKLRNFKNIKNKWFPFQEIIYYYIKDYDEEQDKYFLNSEPRL